MKKVFTVAVSVLLFARLTATQPAIQGSASLAGLTGPSVVGAVNPVICASSNSPSWCSGSDLGAWINAAFTACGFNCVVAIPPGSYSYGTTIQMTKPSESLVGAGSQQTILNYTGPGDGMLWQMKPFSITKAGALRGISFICSSLTINCIHSGSLQGSSWDDVTVSGATGASGVGILLENARITPSVPPYIPVQAWTERTYMHNVHIGYSGQRRIPGNSTGLAFRVNGGTPSFGYGSFDVLLNVELGQTGIVVDTNAIVYHSSLTFQGNIDHVPSSFLTVKGTINQSPFNVLAESVSGNHTNVVHVTPTGIIDTPGNVSISSGDVASTGGNVVPTVDAGGFYAVQPWISLDYPGTAGIIQRPMIETGYQYVSADETVVVAQPAGSLALASDFQGRLVLSWPNQKNRMATMIIDVACAQYETIVCSLSIPVNYAYSGQAVFTNPTIKMTGGRPSVPQIQVTIGNRNGVSQNVVGSWYGAPGSLTDTGPPMLFPGTTPGTRPVRLYGLAFDDAGNLSFNGNQVIPSIVAGYHGSRGVRVQLSDATGTAGSQAVFARDGSLTSSTAGSTGHATCWKAVGQIGYCSTAVSSSGTCTCN